MSPFRNIPVAESDTVEFKTSFQEKVIETLVAFANAKGGKVYIGVRDDGKVQGIEIGKETIQKWLNEIKLKTEPAIVPDVRLLYQDGKTVAVIEVQEYPVKPLSYKGRYYKRIQNANHQLSIAEITSLNLQSLQLSWDAYPKPQKTIDDLSVEKARNFIDQINESGRFRLTGDWITDLKKLRLINDTGISNAAWLLFAHEDTGYHIHIGRFKTASYIVDDRMFGGTLFEMVEQAVNYIISHLKVAFEITGETVRRKEIFEYPLSALRELVLNAVIHRDYMSPRISR
ncbi:MAG TPA: RNA-binding domain-containing protein [Edaphocola sp.]|nr:RNA-binding domain-containing protein [Edaphocola sp.]